MQSALPQSSLNQRLRVIHKLISNVQPCRIVKRLKEWHRIFLMAKLKENKTHIRCSRGPTIQFYLINLNTPHLLLSLCYTPPGYLLKGGLYNSIIWRKCSTELERLTKKHISPDCYSGSDLPHSSSLLLYVFVQGDCDWASRYLSSS